MWLYLPRTLTLTGSVLRFCPLSAPCFLSSPSQILNHASEVVTEPAVQVCEINWLLCCLSPRQPGTQKERAVFDPCDSDEGVCGRGHIRSGRPCPARNDGGSVTIFVR